MLYLVALTEVWFMNVSSSVPCSCVMAVALLLKCLVRSAVVAGDTHMSGQHLQSEKLFGYWNCVGESCMRRVKC